MRFFDRDAGIKKHGTRLPHWQQGTVVQFVTFRLSDAMPVSKVRPWKIERQNWLQRHPKPWTVEVEAEYHRRFTDQLEKWLDAGHGACHLRKPEVRETLEKVLRYDESELAEHHAWVIMPNHVHLLFTPRAPLEELMRKWKGISARRIGLGPIWQRGYRDTLIRDWRHYGNALRYIRKNPARLREGDYSLWERREAP